MDEGDGRPAVIVVVVATATTGQAQAAAKGHSTDGEITDEATPRSVGEQGVRSFLHGLSLCGVSL